MLGLLNVFLASCSAGAPQDGGANGSLSSQFTGSWLCNLTLDQGSAGITTYPPAAVKTVVHGSSLSIYAQELASEPQSWFCGFDYMITGLDAMVVARRRALPTRS
jgi:hypothetical protein